MTDKEIDTLWEDIQLLRREKQISEAVIANGINISRPVIHRYFGSKQILLSGNKKRHELYLTKIIDFLKKSDSQPTTRGPRVFDQKVLLKDALSICEKWMSSYPADIFPADGTSQECHAAKMARHVATMIRDEIRNLVDIGGNHG